MEVDYGKSKSVFPELEMKDGIVYAEHNKTDATYETPRSILADRRVRQKDR